MRTADQASGNHRRRRGCGRHVAALSATAAPLSCGPEPSSTVQVGSASIGASPACRTGPAWLRRSKFTQRSALSRSAYFSGQLRVMRKSTSHVKASRCGIYGIEGHCSPFQGPMGVIELFAGEGLPCRYHGRSLQNRQARDVP